MSIALSVENVSKQYRLGLVGSGTLREDLVGWWYRMRGLEDPTLLIGEENDRTTKGDSNYVWALRDINFEVQQGEVLGIIGKNGAGKSTLLKLLSRVTAPTTGSIKAKGRIASLLEVGTGFHPELTGRENIFLNGAIMGMKRHEINRKLDEIVAFAGVERYLDTPVKRYSSGMYVRLAFAVAAHLEPEILIVDEVLAVGDAEFQKKAIGKMKDVSSGEGRTVLFVSHNMDSISRLCNSCMLMKNGQISASGSTDMVIQSYLQDEAKLNPSITYSADAPGNEIVQLVRAEVIDADGSVRGSFAADEEIGVRLEVKVQASTDDMVFGFNLYNQSGVHILTSHNHEQKKMSFSTGSYETTVWIPKNFLAEGIHTCGVAAMTYSPFSAIFHDVGKIGFNVSNKEGDLVRGDYGGVLPGLVRPKLSWSEIKKA